MSPLLLALLAGCASDVRVVASGESEPGLVACGGPDCCVRGMGLVADDADGLRDANLAAVPDVDLDPGAFDWGQEVALVVYTERCPSDGYSLRPLRVASDGEAWDVRVRLREPRRGADVEARPFVVLAVPDAAARRVRVEVR